MKSQAFAFLVFGLFFKGFYIIFSPQLPAKRLIPIVLDLGLVNPINYDVIA